MAESIQLNVKNLTEKDIENIDAGTVVTDEESQVKFEKRNNKLEVMLEEQTNEPAEIDKIEPAAISKEKIMEVINSGDKIMEANLFMKLQTTKSTLISQREVVNQKVNFMFSGTPEQMDIIQLRVSEITEEAIDKGTLAELEEFLTFDGTVVPLNFNEVMTPEERYEGTKDFLKYLKTIDSTNKEIQKNIDEIDDICTTFSPEVLDKSKSIYEWDKYIYDLFKEKINDPKISDEERNRIKRIVEVKDEALTLKSMLKYVQDEMNAGRKKSFIYAFHNRFDDTLEKAEKYAAKHNFHMYFQLFDNVDEIIGYPDYRNLFVFIFARYVKFNLDKFNKIDNAFIAQISQNLIMLKNNELQEPNKSIFVKGLQNIYKAIIEA